jgi:hypothetical protein
MQVLVNTTDDTNSTALATVTQHLKSVIAASNDAANATDLLWCGAFCQEHAADIDMKLIGGVLPDCCKSCMNCTCSITSARAMQLLCMAVADHMMSTLQTAFVAAAHGTVGNMHLTTHHPALLC